MLQKTLLGVLVVLGMSFPASAAVITFDGLGNSDNNPEIVDGFRFGFETNYPYYHCICYSANSGIQIDNGTDLIAAVTVNDGYPLIVMSVDGGGEFSLTSFLGSNLYFHTEARHFEVTGLLAGGGSIMEAFDTVAGVQTEYFLSPTFTGLTSATFRYFARTGSGLSLDNINATITARDVPEPTPLALLGMGLLGLTFARKRAN